MKTKMNINLRKMGITISAMMALTVASFAIAPADSKNNEMVPAARVEALMNAAEQSVRFVAPSVEESEEVTFAVEELNALAVETEASVKYVAPAAEVTEEVATAMENLDRLASETETAVAFKAPRADESIESNTAGVQMTNLILAHATK